MRLTLNHFFETDVPLIIANRITNKHQLTSDLVNHVFLIMHGKHIDDFAAFFARCAYQQWNWYQSEFNRQYRCEFIELNEDITPTEITDQQESRYQKFLRDYLEDHSGDMVEWYKKEIAKLFIQGMTYREIQSRTTINLRYISETIKQFKHDVRNNFEQSRDGNDTDDNATT